MPNLYLYLELKSQDEISLHLSVLNLTHAWFIFIFRGYCWCFFLAIFNFDWILEEGNFLIKKLQKNGVFCKIHEKNIKYVKNTTKITLTVNKNKHRFQKPVKIVDKNSKFLEKWSSRKEK